MTQRTALTPIRESRKLRRRLVYAGITLGVLVCANYTYALPVFRGVLQDYLNVELRWFGALLNIGVIPAACVALAAGMWIERTGPRAILRTAMLALAVGFAMLAMATHWMMLAAGLLVAASATAACAVAGHAYLIALFPNRRRRAISAALISEAIAGTLFYTAAEYLVQMQDRVAAVSFATVLHLPFAVLAVLFMLGTLLYARAKGLARPTVHLHREPIWKSLPVRRASWGLAGLMMLHMTVDGAVIIWLPTVLASASYDVQTVPPGLAVAGGSLAYLIARVILAWLPEHVGVRAMLVVPGLTGGTVLLLGVLSQSQPLAAAGYVFGALCWSVEYPAMLARAAHLEPRRYGSILGLAILGAAIGSFTLVTFMGMLGDRLGEERLWMILLLPPCGFIGVGLGGALWLRLYQRTNPRPTD